MKSRLATVSFILGVISAICLVVQYLALCDIARQPASRLEWYVVGVCMLVLAAFVATTLAMLWTAQAGRRPK